MLTLLMSKSYFDLKMRCCLTCEDWDNYSSPLLNYDVLFRLRFEFSYDAMNLWFSY